jgi:NDP-sugar pyrophosphorylase family protein
MEGTSYKMNKDSGNDIQVVVIVDFDDGRLFPLTEESPKCLLPIANRKLLAYQLDLLKKSGAKGNHAQVTYKMF